jgi:hypothetical protein
MDNMFVADRLVADRFVANILCGGIIRGIGKTLLQKELLMQRKRGSGGNG